jgi:hypothetical protein
LANKVRSFLASAEGPKPILLGKTGSFVREGRENSRLRDIYETASIVLLMGAIPAPAERLQLAVKSLSH